MTENEIIAELKRGWLTKEDLMAMLGTSERGARDWVANQNIKLMEEGSCVLSSSSRKGYHIPSADCEEDVQMAMHVDKELEDKAISIFQRRKAIRAFATNAIERRTLRAPEPVQLNLFAE